MNSSLRIGDKVIIAVDKCHRPAIVNDNNRGVIIDFKWNMAAIEFPNGATEWVELKRVYHAS